MDDLVKMVSSFWTAGRVRHWPCTSSLVRLVRSDSRSAARRALVLMWFAHFTNRSFVASDQVLAAWMAERILGEAIPLPPVDRSSSLAGVRRFVASDQFRLKNFSLLRLLKRFAAGRIRSPRLERTKNVKSDRRLVGRRAAEEWEKRSNG